MSATPRIVFSTFRSSADPMFLAWARFLQSVEGAARRGGSASRARVTVTVDGAPAETEPIARAVATSPRAGGGAACGVWRLLAPNNRELGRSARAYASFESARAHVLALRAAAADLRIVTVSGDRTGMHGWYLTQGRQAAITCGRWYGASASGTAAALAAIEALPLAEIEESVRRLEPPRRTGDIADDVLW